MIKGNLKGQEKNKMQKERVTKKELLKYLKNLR